MAMESGATRLRFDLALPNPTRLAHAMSLPFVSSSALARTLLGWAAFNSAVAVHAQSFAEVAEYLDLNGDFVTYLDLTGDAATLSAHLTDLYAAFLEGHPEVTPFPIDLVSISEALGLDGLGALGLSSAQIAPQLYHNRSVHLHAGKPKGVFRLFDLTPRPFSAAERAPAEADVAANFHLRLDLFAETAADVVAAVMGPIGRNLTQMQLHQPLVLGTLTPAEWIAVFSHPITFFAEASIDAGGNAKWDLFLEIEGQGAFAERLRNALLPVAPDLETTLDANGRTVLNLSAWTGLAGVTLQLRGAPDGPLTFYSLESYLQAPAQSLAEAPAFAPYRERLPTTAGFFSYSGETTLDDLRPFLEDGGVDPSLAPLFETLFDGLLRGFFSAQASAQSAIPGGVAQDQFAGYSTKEVALGAPAIFVGAMTTAAAIPAVQKVRQTSQEKAVTNNLRQFAAAGQQHMLTEGVTSATYDDLVGPGNYLAVLEPVAGESYLDLIVTMGSTSLQVTLADGRVVRYAF